MSRRFIDDTLDPEPHFIQTPADDLESFSWLLLWVVLKKLEQRTSKDDRSIFLSEMRMLRDLSANDLGKVQLMKHFIALKKIPSLIQGESKSGVLSSSYLKPFAQLLTRWLSLAELKQGSQQTLLGQQYGSPEEKMAECLSTLYADYDEFFAIGMHMLPTLGHAWP